MLQRLGDVVVPRLADDAHRRRAGLDEVAQRGVVVDLALRPGGSSRTPRASSVSSCSSVRGPPEELLVLRVGAGPAALDVVHAEVVELLGDAQLVVDGERDALDLAAVAQRRVEDLDRPGTAPSRRVRRHVRPTPCTGRPGRGRPCRTPPAIAFVIGPGHGIARSSTEFTGVTSAAVPHTNISSAMYRSLRARSSTRTSKPRSRAIVITESCVMPSRAPAASGGVMSLPWRDDEDVLAGALARRSPAG